MTLRSYKYRIYPDREVQNNIALALNHCRYTYNQLLDAYRHREINNISQGSECLNQLKEQNPELKTVYSKTLQRVNDRLFNNISVLTSLRKKGIKTGKLKFKSEFRYRTLDYNQSGFKLTGNTVELSKIGSIKVKFHKKLPEGKIKGILITKSKSGKYYAIFQVETSTIKVLGQIKSVIGLDVGLTEFVYDSDGNHIKNPKYLRQSLRRIKHLQRLLSNKVKFSNNWVKSKCLLAKLFEYVNNQRLNRNHQVSRKYVNNFDAVVVEDLDILRMIQSENNKNLTLSKAGRKGLRRNISDAGWRDFVDKLEYKAESAGKLLVRVNPKNTTQRCNQCGELVFKDLLTREHKCPHCGLTIDRDYNAALNILKEGLKAIECLGVGQELPHYKPVEPLTATTVLTHGCKSLA